MTPIPLLTEAAAPSLAVLDRLRGVSVVDMVAAVAVAGIVLAVCGAIAIFVIMQANKRAERVRQRVGADEHIQKVEGRTVSLFHEGEEIEATLVGEGRKKGLAAKKEAIEACMAAAGYPMSAGAALMVFAGIAAAAFAGILMFTGHPIGSVVGTGVVLFVLQGFVKGRAGKQAAKFDDQFVEALGLVARSLRAGHTVNSGLNLAAMDSEQPVKGVFQEIVQQQELGVSLEESLRRVASAHPSSDLKLFAASVAVQVRAGGNLAETTTRLASVIRERLRLARRVRVLIAQTHIIKQVLLALPIIVFGLLNVINPEYIDPMYSTPIGNTLLTIAISGLLVGAWLMNKMATLKY